MIFIVLMKSRQKPTKELIAENAKLTEKDKKEGLKSLGTYYTLGRYDMVGVVEAPDEKAALKFAMKRAGFLTSETLVAVPAEGARKLIE